VAAGGTITGSVSSPTIQQATVNGTATGNDTFILTPSSVVLNGSTVLSGTFSSLTVHGGGGNDLFQIQGGVVPATIAAGSGNDTFQFFTGAGISGTLDGGGGINTLDYSAYVGDIVVNLPLGTATGVGGGIAHIQNVIGSQGNDLIVGNADANVLQGGTGRNLIIGGAAADAIYGGGGDNLLIGGTTDYDTNLAALNAVMAEWTRTDLGFDQRVNDIRKGRGSLAGTGYHLDSSTVHADPLTDQVWGGSGLNWFFAASPTEINGGAGPGANDRYTLPT
jgi:Ca2+-binding RTX toxin-like protein